MRWRWGIVAIMLGAACASLDGLSGGEAPAPVDGGLTKLPTSDSSTEASAAVPEAAPPPDALATVDAGTFCDQTEAGTQLFCTDFDHGQIMWSTISKGFGGSIALTDAATSPPFGVELEQRGFAGAVSLQQEITSLVAPAPPRLSFAFDVLLTTVSMTVASDLALIGHHNLSAADFELILESAGDGNVNLYVQTPTADGGPGRRLLGQVVSGLESNVWTHFEIRMLVEEPGGVGPADTRVTTFVNGTATPNTATLGAVMAPTTPGLFIQIADVEGTSPLGTSTSGATLFDNVIVSAF